MKRTRLAWFPMFLLLAAWSARGQMSSAEADSAAIEAAFQKWLKVDLEERVPADAATFESHAYAARRHGWHKLEAEICRELGVYYRETGQPDAAQQWFLRLFDMSSEASDSLGIALALANLGNTYMGQGDHQTALEYNRRALAIRIRHQDHEQPVRLANSYMFVGISLMRLGQLAEAETCYKKSYDIRVHRADSAGLALLLGNMGNLALHQRKTELAEAYFQQSLHLQQSAKRRVNALGTYYQSLGEAYSEVGDNRTALRYMQQALAIFDTLKMERRRQNALFFIGRIHIQNGDHALGERALRQSAEIAERRGMLTMARDIYWQLYESARQTGRLEQAIGHYQKFEVYKDSLISLQNARSLARLTMQQDIARKDQAISLLKQQSEAQSLRQRYLLFGLALALLLLSVIYYLNHLRQKAFVNLKQRKQEAEQLLEEKEKLLHDLRNTQQQLIQHEKLAALGQLTAGIAHELNNPLNFIINNAVALRMDHADLRDLLHEHGLNGQHFRELDNEMTQLISGMENGAERMRHIVQELVAFSRAEQSPPESLDLQEIVAESLHLVQRNGRAAWSVAQSWPTQTPKVKGYSGKLVQLFSNLLTNAFDALESRWGKDTQHGQISIEAAVNGNNIVIRLADNGPGMDEPTQQKIFDPFFTTKPVGKGTGLGLSIAFSIVKVHKGTIDVNSTINSGTQFTITFPIE